MAEKSNFLEGYRKNFATLQRACKAGDLAMLECREKATGEIRAVVVAVGFNGKEYTFTPFGHLCPDNPYDVYDPPNPNGGFYGEKEQGGRQSGGRR